MPMMRCAPLLLLALLAAPLSHAQLSIGIDLPQVSIGINLPVYPELVLVPGYPVYYAPRLDVNYFFYDGTYWVYREGDWYASTWYNGPWWVVNPYDVPAFILRIPVRYYRYPPPDFRDWRRGEPPHWGEIWGPRWEEHKHGWDRWNRRAVPAPAPCPSTSGATGEKTIPGSGSGSMSLGSMTTVIIRAIPWCGNCIGSSRRERRPKTGASGSSVPLCRSRTKAERTGGLRAFPNTGAGRGRNGIRAGDSVRRRLVDRIQPDSLPGRL